MNNLSFLNINDFYYHLPDNYIAKYPLTERDSSKILIYNDGQISESIFSNIIDFLPEKSHLVFNDTRVIPARLHFKNKNGAVIEIFLLKPFENTFEFAFQELESSSWYCLVGNKKKWKANETLTFDLIDKNVILQLNIDYLNFESNIINISWDKTAYSFQKILNLLGEIPLPPYLNRESNEQDKSNYQTLYSKIEGAVAAPTAGLHFTDHVFEQLNEHNFTRQFITLHVGAGTFIPVKEQNVINHNMHNEYLIFTKESINSLLQNFENIIPVGTTSLRAIESLYWFGVKLCTKENNSVHEIKFFIEKLFPYKCQQNITIQDSLDAVLNYMNENEITTLSGETEILIMPGYQFKLCKALITNFHQPKSTLLLLISALIGDNWKKVYDYALINNFRFLSYGDSSLLIP